MIRAQRRSPPDRPKRYQLSRTADIPVQDLPCSTPLQHSLILCFLLSLPLQRGSSPVKTLENTQYDARRPQTHLTPLHRLTGSLQANLLLTRVSDLTFPPFVVHLQN